MPDDWIRQCLDAEGADASVLQHEIDHLDGIVTLDRATRAERRRVIGELLVGARVALPRG